MKNFEIMRNLLLLVAFLTLTAGNSPAADVTVYAEGTYTNDEVTVSLYADFSPTRPILSWGVALRYSTEELMVVSAEKNKDVWYLGQPANTFPYMSPDTKTPGVITFIGAKLDAAKPTAGIIGNRVLLGTAKFTRKTSAQPPLKGEKVFFGLSLGPARTASYKSFVTTGGVILDQQIDYTSKGFVFHQASDANIASKSGSTNADGGREGLSTDGEFILFAHGKSDGPNSWESFAKHAGEHGYKVFRTQVDECGSIETRAWQLARFINTLNLPPRSLKAVGHSMGGLDLRMIVGKASESIEPYLSAARTLKKVYTLATPHNGIVFGGKLAGLVTKCLPATADLSNDAMEAFNQQYPYSKFSVDGYQIPFVAFRFVCRPCGGGMSLGETDGIVGFHGQEWSGAPPFTPVLQGQHANSAPLCSPATCVLETENIAVLDQILDDSATDPAWAHTVGKQEKHWSDDTFGSSTIEPDKLQFGADHRWERCQAIVKGHTNKWTFGELTSTAELKAGKAFNLLKLPYSETVSLEINKSVPVIISGKINATEHEENTFWGTITVGSWSSKGGATVAATCYFDGPSGRQSQTQTLSKETNLGGSEDFELTFGADHQWVSCDAKVTNTSEHYTSGNVYIRALTKRNTILFSNQLSPLYNEDGDIISMDVWDNVPVDFTGWIANKHGVGAGATVDATCFYNKADFNGDGKIDMPDIEKLAATFGRSDCKTGPSCDADFNGDSVVDGMDAAGFALAMRRNLSKKKVHEFGESGFITLVNGTRYDWKKTYQQQDQMYHWRLPDTIPAGSSSTGYVQWDTTKAPADDEGKATYTLGETGLNFQVQAPPRNKFPLGIQLINFGTQGNPQGSTINRELAKDGYVNFILSGEEGAFTSSNLSSSWMQNYLSILGDRTLRQLCIPGSHDSGMSTFASGTTV